MKNLLLLRHAKSGWGKIDLDDFDRPLAPRGIKSLSVMAITIDRLPNQLQKICSSNAKRALETANGIAQKINNPPQIEEYPSLYLAELQTFIELAQSLPDELNNIMFVAHNPGLEEFLDWLCCGQRVGISSMRTANLAWLELDIIHWKETASSCAVLRALIPSRLMKTILD